MKKIVFIACVALAAAACSDKPKADAKPAEKATAEVKKAAEPAKAETAKAEPVKAAAADPAAEAKTMYTTLCATCHGATGAGDGIAGKALKPAPRNFTDAAWHGKTDDAKILKVIMEGGPAAGLSPLMAPFGAQLKGKDDVQKELVKLIRSFKK